MYSVMLLITSFGALAGLYVLLDAPFAAVTQIIIYAGAIMVLFLFVVMLLNAPHEETGADVAGAACCGPGGRCSSAALLAVVLVVELVWALSRVGGRRLVLARPAGSVSSVAEHRPGAVHRLRVRLRSDVDPDPGGDGRRGGAGAPRDQRDDR